MPRHISLLFPGQGSQSVGMLNDFDESKINQIKEISNNLFDFDLVDVIKNGPDDLINRTSITQPALLATSFLYFKKFLTLSKALPNIFAGHSLGEYSALVAAESISLEDAMSIVHKRGLFMESCPKGAMYAILNFDLDVINKICKKVTLELNDVVSAANINSENQVVIAGSLEAAKKVADDCKNAGAKRCIQLNVSVASHCYLMEAASKQLSSELDKFIFKAPKFPIIHNIDAEFENKTINFSRSMG
jgi:[acyl-carrier-protein] S-malonyltransferase